MTRQHPVAMRAAGSTWSSCWRRWVWGGGFGGAAAGVCGGGGGGLGWWWWCSCWGSGWRVGVGLGGGGCVGGGEEGAVVLQLLGDRASGCLCGVCFFWGGGGNNSTNTCLYPCNGHIVHRVAGVHRQMPHARTHSHTHSHLSATPPPPLPPPQHPHTHTHTLHSTLMVLRLTVTWCSVRACVCLAPSPTTGQQWSHTSTRQAATAPQYCHVC